MKMADGGFRPAFNGEFATDTRTQIIVGVDAANAGSDLAGWCRWSSNWTGGVWSGAGGHGRDRVISGGAATRRFIHNL
jgi:hypothetical protein